MIARVRFIPLLLAAFLASSVAAAQGIDAARPSQAPRFLRASADSRDAPVILDPLTIPALRRKIAVHLRDIPRGDALRQVGAESGLQFVFANDVVRANEHVTVQADSITVAAAIERILTGAGVDVALGANGSAILVKKARVARTVPRGSECKIPAADEEPLPLCLDGNGVPGLKAFVKLEGNDASIAAALRGIAATARVPISLDVDVLALHAEMATPEGFYSVAEALLRTVSGKPVAIFVTPSGGLTVRALADGFSLAPVVTTAAADARQTFELKPMMGSLKLSVKDLSAAPMIFEGDVFKSLQLLPGVEVRNDYSAGLNVRGGESDQNLILLDGYPIYNPFHLGGLLGTFIEPLVGSVELITGAQPVRFGERLSSVLNVTSAEATQEGFHGAADVSLLSAAAAAGSVFDGGGSWMIGGRHTYADVIANIIKKNSLPYGFSDVQAHISRPVFGNAILSATGYNGADGAQIVNNTGDLEVAWGNRVFGATLSKMITGRRRALGLFAVDSMLLVQRLSATTFDARVITTTSDFALRSSVRDFRTSGAATFFSEAFDHAIGYEISSQHVRYSMHSGLTSITNFLPQGSFDESLTPVSGWYDAIWRASPKLLVNAGARVDAVSGTGWAGLSPRLSLKYFLTRDLALIASTGSYAQWLHSLAQENAPVQPLEFWIASSKAIPISRAWQSSLGIERWTSPTRQLRVEAFYKKYSNLIETNPSNDPLVNGDEYIELTGTSYGADVLLRQLDNGKFGGWIAYSFAVSARVTSGGVSFSPGQDRRHALNAVGTWKVERYRISARLGLTTGTPYTPVTGAFTRERYDPVGNSYAPDLGGGDIQYISGVANSARMPFEHRVDISIMRPGSGDRVQISPYLSIVNIYNAANPAGYVFNYSTGKYPSRQAFVPTPERVSIPNLPFLPTIGVHIAY